MQNATQITPNATQITPSAQAVILAAGNGFRLRDAIGDQSKCLAEIDGRPLILRQLDALEDAGVSDVTIVVGYDEATVRRVVGRRASFVQNLQYHSTNSLVSFLAAAPRVAGDVFVVNCDVLFPADVLERMNCLSGSVVAYDSSSGSEAEQMKVALTPDGALVGMSKEIAPEFVGGENLGILRFDHDAARTVAAIGTELLKQGREMAWLAEAVDAASDAHRFACLDVAGTPWVEIDFPEDLQRARNDVWPALVQTNKKLFVQRERETAHG